MANNIKEVLTKPMPRNLSAQAMLFGVGGGYMIYTAFDLLRASYTGATDISVKVAWIVAVGMVLGGLFVLSYALRLWRAYKKAQEEENARLLEARLAREAAEAAEAAEDEEYEEDDYVEETEEE